MRRRTESIQVWAIQDTESGEVYAISEDYDKAVDTALEEHIDRRGKMKAVLTKQIF